MQKTAFVCCQGNCRRIKEKEVTIEIEARGNQVVKNSYFVISEFKLQPRVPRMEIERTYLVLIEKLVDDLSGRMFNKVETCGCIELTNRQEAFIARRII